MDKKDFKTVKSKPLFREFSLENREINEENRTIDVVFSTEERVARWFGNEILDHSLSSVRIERLRKAGSFLVNHRADEHVGVIESARIDPAERKGYATIRFGSSQHAKDIFQDIIDGIRKSISVGYRVIKAILEEENDEGLSTYRIVDWEPLEISVVSIPGDINAEVIRENVAESDFKIEIVNKSPKKEERSMAVETEVKTPVIDVKEIENVARSAELDRIRNLTTIGENHSATDLARNFINNGGTVEQLNQAILDRMGIPAAVEAESSEIGLTPRETEQFSFLRAINALANPSDRRVQEAAAFEFDCSSASAKKLRRESRGLTIPIDVIKRALTVGSNTAGGHTVATDLLSGSFIDLLRNRSMMMNPGMATILTDLNGNIAIPRQTGGVTGYWVAEEGAPTESQATFDQVVLSPNTVGAFTDFSRKLIIQSSIDVEGFVRADLARVLALAIDRAAIAGSGSGNEPTGILNVTGIGDVVVGTNGGVPTWPNLIQLESDVAGSNADVMDMHYLTTAPMRGALKSVDKAVGAAKFVWEGNEVNGYESLATNQVPNNLVKGTSTDCHAIVFGNFSDLFIAMWGGLDINVDTSTHSTTGSVRVVALQDADIAARHAESFAAIQDARVA